MNICNQNQDQQQSGGQEPALESFEATGSEARSYIGTASYSPDDNKLRLYSFRRLDAETYARVKDAGFKWAPKQDLFFAPCWSPSRAALLIELCGEIGDEDTTLVERAEERAERFEDYSDKRSAEASSARRGVDKIAKRFEFGQPILVGHHSEKRARKDQERIQSGMRRAVDLWETSGYWTRRAEGALRNAKYKELPNVRARRIKRLEAEQRSTQRTNDNAVAVLKLWNSDKELTLERALAITGQCCGISWSFPLADFPRDPPASQYEGPMSLYSALSGERSIITPEQARELARNAYRRSLASCAEWLTHYSHRLSYERAMLQESGGTLAMQTGPEKGGAVRCWAAPRGGWAFIKKVNRVSVTIESNWGNGGRNFTQTVEFDKLAQIMTAAQVTEARNASRLVETDDKCGFYLAAPKPEHDAGEVVTCPPAAEVAPEASAEDASENTNEAQAFAAMRDQLKQGVSVPVVHAPQLFPTPADLSARMASLAELEPGQLVLEPSAGTGVLLAAIRNDEPGAITTAVEINYQLVDHLRTRYENVQQRDFLECGAELGQFDRVVMNPPFVNGADIKHIQHAFGMLKPGGVLVALCANGPRQNDQLRPLVELSGGEWEPLPADTFKQEGTSVRTVLLTLRAAAEA
jgi:phospholipid N-methyltransferase